MEEFKHLGYSPESYKELQLFFVYGLAQVSYDKTADNADLVFAFAEDFVRAVKNLIDGREIRDFSER